MFIFNTATTANGFLADPNDSLEWLFQVKSEAPDMEPFTRTVSVFVMGSSTYEWLLHTENILGFPEKWTEFFGERPTYVFTSRDLPVPPGVDVRFLNSTVPQALPTITEAAGDGTVWVMGGGDLVGQFLDAGALDRIIMTLAPAFLDSGKPLLPRTVYPDRLTLKGARTVGQFVEITYDVTGSRPSA
ncbi:dihydrofolate reductase [Kocuria sp. cx-455]|uniref:dihydrofolate reductase family protein n=1 Tax=Kocuria sp. cx-455 TaxID=2771377 RepID=UPI00168287C3|nr:dihydrofolate reductase family protein [Kocuria sp. cx-455]MBD2765858.1 dihydrofolate reductase [Kocuria sp. cx-455]